MSITLNAFRDYKYDEESESIKYIGNESIDLCASTWVHKLYPILEKASELAGCDISINTYDVFDHAHLAKDRKLKLVRPEDMVIALEMAKDYYSKLDNTDEDNYIGFIEGILLPRAKKGLYFTSD